MPKPNDDLQAGNNLKRIDDLEEFREKFEGKEFDKKVESSIEDSTGIQNKIKNLVWCTIKEKLVWIILTLLGLLLFDALKDMAGKLLDKL